MAQNPAADIRFVFLIDQFKRSFAGKDEANTVFSKTFLCSDADTFRILSFLDFGQDFLRNKKTLIVDLFWDLQSFHLSFNEVHAVFNGMAFKHFSFHVTLPVFLPDDS